MRRGMVLGEVVSQVLSSRAPVNDEVILSDAVTHPIEAHVYGFGAALFDGVINDTCRAGIVRLDGRWGLRMTEISKSGAQPRCVFGIVEQGAHFSFGGRREDDAHDTAWHMYGAIHGGRGVFRKWCGMRVSGA